MRFCTRLDPEVVVKSVSFLYRDMGTIFGPGMVIVFGYVMLFTSDNPEAVQPPSIDVASPLASISPSSLVSNLSLSPTNDPENPVAEVLCEHS